MSPPRTRQSAAPQKNGSREASPFNTQVLQRGTYLVDRAPEGEPRGELARHPAKAEMWQADAFGYFHAIGLIKQAGYFLANTMSLVRLYIGVRGDDDQDPEVPPAGYAGLFEANDVLDRIRNESGSHGWFLRAATLNLKAAGEYYVVGYPEVPPEPPSPANQMKGADGEAERWAVHSVLELTKDGNDYKIREKRADQGKRIPKDAVVLRCWVPDPAWGMQADCVLRSLLLEMEEYLTLSRAIRAAATNRASQAGILFYPNEFELEVVGNPEHDEDQEDEEEKPFGQTLQERMSVAIQNEGSAAARVPLVVRGPAEHADKMRFIDMDREFDAIAATQRTELRERFGQDMDVPIEQLTGLGKMNHWSGYLVDQATWGRYGNPTALTIVESLTEGLLRPMLASAGLDLNGPAGRLVVWYDPAGAIMDPDKIDTAFKAHDRLLISDDSARLATGYTDEDAITDDDEWERRLGQGVPVSQGGDPMQPPEEQARSRGPVAAVRRLFARNNRRQRTMVGRRLMEIDRTLRTRLLEQADASMLRALERAGARVRQQARADATARALTKDEPAWNVCAKLGREAVAAFELTDDDLLADAFADLFPRFDSRMTAAQKRALRLAAAELGLTDAEVSALASRQDEDRAGAWVWFQGALMAIAAQRLFNPNPTAPPRGEITVDSRVPMGVVREAMARAGGGIVADRPNSLALGDLVLDTFARHGRIVDAWVWVYGDESSRLRVFEPHLALDGERFQSWEDPVLAVSGEDGWLDTAFYQPGDHDGCGCDAEADLGGEE